MQAVALLNNPARTALLVAGALAAAGAQAQGDAAACPPAVQAEQRASSPPAGWEAAIAGDMSHTLAGITFFAGPPARQASLVPDERAAGKGRLVATWPLSPSGTYWVACSYVGTRVVLQRQLPPGLKSCSVSYDTRVRVAGLPEIVKIECK